MSERPWEQRPRGPLHPFKDLRYGQAFQFQEIKRISMCRIDYVCQEYTRYERDQWFYRIYAHEPAYQKLVELF